MTKTKSRIYRLTNLSHNTWLVRADSPEEAVAVSVDIKRIKNPQNARKIEDVTGTPAATKGKVWDA